MATGKRRRPTIVGVLRRNPEFRALAFANSMSLAGDDLARIALAIVFYERTQSAFIAAFTFALSFLPAFFGGPVLAALGDRFPRRRVMVVCDIARACLVGLGAAALALNWTAAIPLGALVVAAFLGPPFEASRAALMPQVVPGDDYVVASTATAIAAQVSQIVTYILGAAAVATLGGDGALFLDACSFGISALVLLAFVEAGEHPQSPAGRASVGLLAMTMEGARDVFERPALRALLTVAATTVAACAVAEGLAVVYAAQHGVTGLRQGLLVAAIPLGTALGGVVLTRFVRAARQPAMIRPLAVGTCIPLIATALPVGPTVVFVLWVAVGVLLAFQFVANAAFVLQTPDHLRARAIGLAQSLMALAQTAAMLAGGAIASSVDPRYVVGGAGGLALVAMLRTISRWPAGISVIRETTASEPYVAAATPPAAAP